MKPEQLLVIAERAFRPRNTECDRILVWRKRYNPVNGPFRGKKFSNLDATKDTTNYSIT